MAYCRLKYRKNSRGEKIYYVDYKFRDRRSKFTIGAVEARAAKKIADKIRANLINGIDPHELQKQNSDAIQTLNELAFRYLTHCQVSQSPKTIEMKLLAVRKLERYLKNSRLKSISPEDIEKWMINMQESLSASSVSIYFRAIKAMFSWGIKRGIITSSPFDNGNVSDVRLPDTDPDDYFSIEEIAMIYYEAKKNKQLYRLIFLALETGGRITELIRLRKEDIENGTVLFRGSETKTGKKRYVPLRDSTAETIKIWYLKSDYIFNWETKDYPSRAFKRILVKLGLRNTKSGSRSFHTLRHTFASHLLVSGIDIFTVSRLLGHSSVTVTEKHYGHLVPDAAKQAIEKIPY